MPSRGDEAVERLHKMTSFIGLQTLANMIRHGTLKDLKDTLTVEDEEN